MTWLIAIGLYGIGLFTEILFLRVRAWWPSRVIGMGAGVLCTGFIGAVFFAWYPSLFSGMFLLIAVYKVGNNFRVVQGRAHESYLCRSALRTLVVLSGLQSVVLGCWIAWDAVRIPSGSAWCALATVQLLIAGVLCISIVRRLQRTAWPATVELLNEQAAPTISVAIPARNETDDLQQCLESILASNYPKLEVLVLDDCSQNQRTPEIIRGFAHDGVRFIQGQEPQNTWLPKNQAYAQLAAEASGDYIIFCGVDIRFDHDAIHKLISTTLAKKKRMLSLLPTRGPQAQLQFSLSQAMRYFWELVPPRRIFNRPPVLSSCWIIEKQALTEMGGFAAVTRSIVPEAYFARKLTKTDAYSFMRAGLGLGVQSVKGPEDQRQTAIRTRYPQVHRRPENVLLVSLAELTFLVLPFVVALTGWLWHAGTWAIALAVATSVVLTVIYELVVLNTKVNTPLFGLIALPFAVIYDVIMLHISMWQYEFAVVTWKDRNICIPAMHVIPHLPKLD